MKEVTLWIYFTGSNASDDNNGILKLKMSDMEWWCLEKNLSEHRITGFYYHKESKVMINWDQVTYVLVG